MGGALKGPIRVGLHPRSSTYDGSHKIHNQYKVCLGEINDLLLRLFPTKSEMEPASLRVLPLNNCMQAHQIVFNR